MFPFMQGQTPTTPQVGGQSPMPWFSQMPQIFQGGQAFHYPFSFGPDQLAKIQAQIQQAQQGLPGAGRSLFDFSDPNSTFAQRFQNTPLMDRRGLSALWSQQPTSYTPGSAATGGFSTSVIPASPLGGLLGKFGSLFG